jgi:hypothetical protein
MGKELKDFAIRATAFAAVLWAVFHMVDRMLDTAMLRARTGEVGVWADLYDGKVQAEMVVHGSSRAWVHMDPQILQDSLGLTCYNLGVDGHSFQLQTLRNDLLFRYCGKPKLIIHSIDMWTLVDRGELYGGEQFLPFFHDTAAVRRMKQLKGYHRLDYELPLTRYFGFPKQMKVLLNGMLRGTWPEEERKRGFMGQERPWQGDLEKARGNWADGYKVVLDSNITHEIDDYLGRMRNEGVKVIFVYTPELKEGQGFVTTRAEIMALYWRLARKHGITFIDYSDHPLSDNSNKHLYYNASHMNAEGAEIFSRTLAHDLRQLPELNGIIRQ